MAVTSTRTETIAYTVDEVSTNVATAASNAASPGQVQPIALSMGNNTITVPAAGTTPVAVRIQPPAGNTQALIIKGVNGDTGISIHLTDYTTIALAAGVTSFVINAAGAVNIRLFWC